MVLTGYMGNWAGIQMPRSLRSLCRELPALDARGNYLCCRGKPLPERERLPPFKENKKLLLVEVEQRRHPGEEAEVGRGAWSLCLHVPRASCCHDHRELWAITPLVSSGMTQTGCSFQSDQNVERTSKKQTIETTQAKNTQAPGARHPVPP